MTLQYDLLCAAGAETTRTRSHRMLAVRETPTHDRPDERLVRHGATALSTAEVLAVAIGCELAAAHDLLARHEGRLRTLAGAPAGTYRDTPGIGESRARRLAAAFELGRRFCHEPAEERPALRSPRDVFHHFAPTMSDLPVEEVHAVLLDAQHRMHRDVTVSRGLLNASLVHPREVFREAVADRAAALILVHNHPSGDPTPSADDRAVTQQIVAAGKLLDIPVHDHVIVGRGRYTSFAEAGLL